MSPPERPQQNPSDASDGAPESNLGMDGATFGASAGFALELSPGNWMRAEPNPSRGAGAWRMDFNTAEAAQSVIRARFHFLRDIRSANAKTRAQALAKMRELPFMLDGMHSEWVDFSQAIEREEGPTTQEALPEDRASVAKMHAEASLGPWMNTDDDAAAEAKRLAREAEEAAAVAAGDDPEPVRVQRAENGHWIFTPNGHWLIDSAIFGDMGSLGGVLEAGADPSLARPQPLTAERKKQDALRAENGDEPFPAPVLGVWNYCLTVLQAEIDDWIVMRIGVAEEDNPQNWSVEKLLAHMAEGKKNTMAVLSLCLSFGLKPMDKNFAWHMENGWKWDAPKRGLEGTLHKQMRAAMEAFTMREAIDSASAKGRAVDSPAKIPPRRV